MGYGSIVSIFDRLSIKTVLTNYTGSYIGFLATLAFIIVCLIVLIPPVNLYFSGAYFESQFLANQFPKAVYNTGDDVILSMVFRNRKTGELANHTDILQNLNSYGYYYGQDNTYKTDLQPCKPEVFLNAINPMVINDCIMMPSNLEYDITPISGVIPLLQMAFSYKCDDVFKCSENSPYYNQTVQYIINLAKTYYYEFIFNSKVLDEKGRQTNQFHKLYSTEFASPDGLAAYTMVEMSQKRYFVDDSILPWWNNRTYSNVYWAGKAIGMDGPQAAVQLIGYYNDYYVFTQNIYSYRYYKKLDFILGMIGGAVFLIFMFFWVPCSYFNRTLQKMKNAEQLLFSRDTIITTDQNLHKIKIPWYYPFTRYLPCNNTNQIIQAAQNEIDIVKLIKKMKVTHRNLRTKGVDVTFKSKDVDLTSNEPEQFIPDRPVLQNYEITLDAYQALSKSPNAAKIYQNNPAVLALTEHNNQKLDTVMLDQNYEKIRPSKFASVKERILHNFVEVVKFFDIFGAKPMLNAEPQTSSCWGFFLTLVIIVLSVLTFALTIKNMDSIKIITSSKYEQPTQHNYVMTTSADFRFAFCVPGAAITAIAGANKTVQITFFKNSKKNGYQELSIEKMLQGEFKDYYELDSENPYSQVKSQNCFRPIAGQKIPIGGSYQTINEAYFGVKLEPYCNGLPSECAARKNQTIADFVKFVNYNTYGVYLSQNRYSPDEGRLISGIVGNQVSESDYVMNASLLRTETFYVPAVELLDDIEKSFLRNPPKSRVKTMAFSGFGDRNQQRKGNATADPAYILEFRPNGQIEQIIRRSYKIDFLLGLIGGCFVFWYFFVHFFAKFYNSYKVRAKLAEVLHQQDGYDESMLVHFLYLINFPSSLCCFSGVRQDIDRIHLVDRKIERDLDYLNLVKSVDTCYRLSSSLFDRIAEKDLSLIYFRQKIDEAELVKPKRINELKNNQFEDDEFLEFDDENLNQDLTSVNNGTGNLLPEVSMPDIDLQKIINLNRSKEQSPLYDPLIPNKKQNHITRFIKRLDAFRNPPELTLNGQRDVKSICGAIMFFILATLIIIVCYYFLKIYTSGSDYTVSHRRIVDGNLDVIDSSNTLGELNPGIHLYSGKNFKFAVAFNKKDRYYPHNVSQYIGPIGIRMLQYTVDKSNGEINQSYEEFELEPCNETYFNGFLSTYNDKEAFANINLGYCVPDGKALSVTGIPQDKTNTYFKLNIYNKYQNSTGKAYLNSFFKIYLVTYYMSVPRMDIFAKDFQYQMIKFNYLTDTYSIPLQENITMTKVIFTDKYYSRSRETYNDRSKKSNERIDTNYLASQNARNLSFYYNGMLDHYSLDYPGGAELFGLVGGVIALFIFFTFNFVSSFNEYRMKYLIGQRLYTFDKKLSGLSKEKGKKINIKKIEEATKKINNFNQLQILLAWILNPIGYIRDNYNFNKTLRRITLLIDRVQNDINLYNVYKNLLTQKHALDKKVRLSPSEERQYDHINLTSIFIKHIYNPDPIENHIPIISKESKKHKLSSYEQVKIKNAIDAQIDPKSVLGDKVLNRAFGLDDGSSIFRPEIEREDVINEDDRNENKKKGKGKPKKKNHDAQNSEAQIKLNQRDESRVAPANVEAFEIQQSSRAEDD